MFLYIELFIDKVKLYLYLYLIFIGNYDNSFFMYKSYSLRIYSKKVEFSLDLFMLQLVKAFPLVYLRFYMQCKACFDPLDILVCL